MDRYTRETRRLYGVLNTQLAHNAFIGGQDYSIADMACYPWIVPWQRQQMQLTDFPHLQRWFNTIAARPACQRAYAVGEQAQFEQPKQFNDEARNILFGQSSSTVK